MERRSGRAADKGSETRRRIREKVRVRRGCRGARERERERERESGRAGPGGVCETDSLCRAAGGGWRVAGDGGRFVRKGNSR
jgi:hypothetical protein